jgi:hypothetical protein
LLPFYSLRWSHVLPCHAALQQPKKKERCKSPLKTLTLNTARHQNDNNQSGESRKTCASQQVLSSSPPFLVPRSHVNSLILFLFPVHT